MLEVNEMNICSESDCFGCGACQNICPQNAIFVSYSKEGFLYPHIKENCVHCLKCRKVCPAINGFEEKHKPIKVFKGFSNDLSVRKDSTSGGVFSELASQVIKENGVVYGAFLDSDLNVKHIGVESLDNLCKLRGSKYVGSDTSNVFRNVREALMNGRVVLFSGTPCQIEGLYLYLGKESRENLFTCDFICHGVGSMRIFQELIKHLEKKKNSKAQKVYFRSKVRGYRSSSFYVVFENGGRYISKSYRNEFGYAFSRGMINRLSCSKCKFATEYRLSDITLSDCLLDLNKDEKKNGCSFVMINTAKGERLISSCKVSVTRISLEQVINSQPHMSGPQPSHMNRENIMNDIDIPFTEKKKKYLKVPKKNFVRSIWYRVKNAIKQRNKR